jgi:Na+/H+ antiporter NhaD/arsenite permease-like protein
MLFGISIDFILFGLTLAGVALFHRHTLKVALTGLAAVTLHRLLFTGFPAGPGLMGLGAHLAHEWVMLVNLLALLVGFALLARHFDESRLPLAMPHILPDDWKGGFLLLLIIFVLSGFLDNIAAAIIGGTMARALFQGKVHIAYLTAIVAAANAGGAGSVLGDTTTTMMWIDGVNPLHVLDAYIASFGAFAFFAVFAARTQQKYSPCMKDMPEGTHLDWVRIGIVVAILTSALSANVVAHLYFPRILDAFPVLGVAVWLAILVTAPIRKPAWSLLPEALKGSAFLLALVLCASMMPVEKLPAASWWTTLGLGFLSSIFDNIPLTALALKQGGYDWGLLAYAVGFGGSMIWFGSSAGVAVSNSFPEARSVGLWLRHGWFVPIGYLVGFFILLALLGWHPQERRKDVTFLPQSDKSVRTTLHQKQANPMAELLRSLRRSQVHIVRQDEVVTKAAADRKVGDEGDLHRSRDEVANEDAELRARRERGRELRSRFLLRLDERPQPRFVSRKGGAMISARVA